MQLMIHSSAKEIHLRRGRIRPMFASGCCPYSPQVGKHPSMFLRKLRWPRPWLVPRLRSLWRAVNRGFLCKGIDAQSGRRFSKKPNRSRKPSEKTDS